jgi:hypothetical protein
VTLDGTKFEGEWRNGLPSDYGTFFYKSGGKYVGEFITTKETFIYHGRGTETLPNGEKYMGEWKDDKLNGKGAAIFTDGAKYVGEYKDNKRNGRGTYTDSKGKSTSGRYEDDKKVGRHIEINY